MKIEFIKFKYKMISKIKCILSKIGFNHYEIPCCDFCKFWDWKTSYDEDGSVLQEDCWCKIKQKNTWIGSGCKDYICRMCGAKAK